MRKAELDYSRWYDVKIKTDEKTLRKILNEAELEQDEIEPIIKRFETVGGSQGLWQPESASIFCDEGVPPLTYGHEKTQPVRLNDDKITLQGGEKISWQEAWKIVFGNIEFFNSNYYLEPLLLYSQRSYKEFRS